jgi:hypothetical protein
MRYVVTARVKPGSGARLQEAIDSGTLGAGSIAGDEYLRNMAEARELPDGCVRWVEVCYCPVPLEEERPYWEEFFHLVDIRDAHARSRCSHENGTARWACDGCDCTAGLERRLSRQGVPFLRGADRRER